MTAQFTPKPVGASLLAMLAFLSGCEKPTAATPSNGETAPATRVEVVRPTRRNIRRTVAEPGQVQAFETTEVHAKIAGYVRAWHVNIGEKVRKGQVLAEIDVPELQAEWEQRNAEIAQAEALRVQSEAASRVAKAAVETAEAKTVEALAGVKRVTADLERWRTEHQRVDRLYREHAVDGALLDETRSKLLAAESAREEIDAQVAAAKAGVAQSRAAFDKSSADLAAAATAVSVAKAAARRVEALLGYLKIVAPFDGVVIRRNVDTGDLTAPGIQAEPLFVVARTDLATVAVGVPELYAPEVDHGDRATIRIQALPGRLFEGKVTRTAQALALKSRTLRAEIDLPNPDGILLPGLYAYATIAVQERSRVLALPNSAVFEDGTQRYCVVVRKGRALKIPIRVGIADDAWTEILTGLDPTEQVVKSNPSGIPNGQAIQAWISPSDKSSQKDLPRDLRRDSINQPIISK